MLKKNRLKSIWNGMKSRCGDASNKYYGGKGIKICKEWSTFETFSQWAINNGYTNNLTIDRIDSSKDYSPNNCQWLSGTDNLIKGRRIANIEQLKTIKKLRREKTLIHVNIDSIIYKQLKKNAGIQDMPTSWLIDEIFYQYNKTFLRRG